MLFRREQQQETLSPAESLLYDCLYAVKGMTKKQFEAFIEMAKNIHEADQYAKNAAGREDVINKAEREIQQELDQEVK